MSKFYVPNKEELNNEELRTGKVSYKRIIDRYIDNLVLCNDIVYLDESVWDNIVNDYEDIEIYQYYLCNLSDYEKETLEEYGIILSYSDKLNLDVLLVEHYGTSWDYVMTDVEWTLNYDEA